MDCPTCTQFKAELWTTVSGPGETREVWATIMLNGPDKGWPCAFGPKDKMEGYAQKLNASEGETAVNETTTRILIQAGS